MKESGWYPPGAEHDPRAPWNWDDEFEEFEEHHPYCALNTGKPYERCDCRDED